MDGCGLMEKLLVVAGCQWSICGPVGSRTVIMQEEQKGVVTSAKRSALIRSPRP
jgi:hypothetical protein